MLDSFTITIIFIIACTVIGAFVKGRARDRCLIDFSGYPAVLEKNDGKVIWGELAVEHSGLELIYKTPHLDEKEDHLESSYILYKSEYDQLKTLVRYIDELDSSLAKKREKVLKRTCHPSWGVRFARKTRNFFGTVRDSLLEMVNLFMGRMKAMTPAGKLLKGQDKYMSQLQNQAVTGLCSAYEPILERYIGKKCVLAFIFEGEKTEYAGILKDYTTEFVSMMDVEYADKQSQGSKDKKSLRKADLVIPRRLGTVRHASLRDMK